MILFMFSAAVFANISISNSVQKDTISGIIYVDQEDHIYIEVKHPVHQIFTFRGDTLLLYYPVDKKAFLFSEFNPMELPVSKALLGSGKECDLSTYGFRFLKKKSKGDTTLSYWKKEKGGTVVLKTLKGKLIEILILHDGKEAGKTTYSDYKECKGLHLPSRIHSQINTKNGILTEDVTFTDVQFLDAFPDSLKHIKIPKDVEVKGW